MDRIHEAQNDQALRTSASTGLSCPICGEYGLGPPHGWGNPCPFKIKESEAYVAMLDAQRMANLRTGVGVEEMAQSIQQTMRRIGGAEDDDES